GYEVQCYMANIGQIEDFDAAKEKALKIGATAVYIEDIRRDFVNTTIFPAIQANCIYEGVYLLGTSLARPVIAAKQMEIAKREGCQFVSHGCTGKGNDQVRFELAFYAIDPKIQVIAPWRIPEFYNRFQGRSDLLAYAAEKGIPVQQTAAKPWSTDENLYHISFEAGILEDPNVTPPKEMWKLTTNPEEAPNTPEHIAITFKAGIPVKVENLDDGGTILRACHVDLEGICMDREARRLRDSLGVRLSEILYNGYWFTAEREIIQAAVTESQKYIDGTVRCKLYKGSVTMEGRTSPNSLYDQDLSSMDIAGGFHPLDSEGFIKIQSIRLKAYTDMKNRLAN
ncbi:hypothetical protein PIROE2DRAFT_67638, partial [Piromyces sp. E2]